MHPAEPLHRAPSPNRAASDAFWRRLHGAATGPCRTAGRFAWHFARGKLGRDPVLRSMLERDDFKSGSCVVDIGCGQGLLASLLHSGDMRYPPLPPCDPVVILDVLHYVDRAAQDDLLGRVRDALQPHGRLLLRVGDMDDALGFRISQWVDKAVTWVRGHRAPPTWGRTVAQWSAALQGLGFRVHAVPMSAGTPFVNVLLVADL